MEPTCTVVTMTPMQRRQHEKSLESSERMLEEIVSRAGKTPGASTKARIRDLQRHISHTKALLGEGSWITHKDGRDEFPLQRPKRASKPKPQDDDAAGLLEKAMIVARAIEKEFVLEKQSEEVVEAPAPPENPPSAGMQLSLFPNLPELPKSISRGTLKDRLKSINRGKTAI